MEKKNNITLQTADLSRTKTLAAFTSWATFLKREPCRLENLKPYWCWNKNSLYQTSKTYIPQQICLCQTFKEKEDESISCFWIGVPNTLSFFESRDQVFQVWGLSCFSLACRAAICCWIKAASSAVKKYPTIKYIQNWTLFTCILNVCNKICYEIL